MASIPSKVADRLVAGIKRFQPILISAQNRDVNESDTAIIITDMLSDVFGYDKYSEVTSETAIRGTFCDLAIKMDGVLQFLIEAKAIGQELKDAYLKQAIDYAANKGVDWVVLTTGVLWRIYKVTFSKPIDHELIAEFNFLSLNPRDDDHVATLYLLTREGWTKSALVEFFDQKQALSRFSLAAIVVCEPVLKAIRKQVKALSPDVRIDMDDIRSVLENEVLKREVVREKKQMRRRSESVGRQTGRRSRMKEKREKCYPRRTHRPNPLPKQRPQRRLGPVSLPNAPGDQMDSPPRKGSSASDRAPAPD